MFILTHTVNCRPQQMSPASSAGETNASSFPSMLEDATYLRLRPRRNSTHDG